MVLIIFKVNLSLVNEFKKLFFLFSLSFTKDVNSLVNVELSSNNKVVLRNSIISSIKSFNGICSKTLSKYKIYLNIK